MDRFILKRSEERPSEWVCTDTKNKIVCTFEHRAFNQTQRITFLEGINEPALDEMRLWLTQKHHDKIR